MNKPATFRQCPGQALPAREAKLRTGTAASRPCSEVLVDKKQLLEAVYLVGWVGCLRAATTFLAVLGCSTHPPENFKIF